MYLNVQNLVYDNDSRDLGSIPKGYYDFVYTGPDGEEGFIGGLELRLAATDLDQPEIPASPDISPDIRPDIRHESGDVITIVSREVVVQYVSSDSAIGVGSSSSSGCTSGFGLAGLILLSGLVAAMKKR